MSTNIYETRRYYALALDPVHVGAGGYRLGRVDLSIVREPGDNLPKIPGSSLAGTARAFTALCTDRYRVKREVTRGDNHEPEIRLVSCAGKGGDDGSEHCCRPDCPVCVAFGFSNGSTRRSLQGMAQFFDARILFFPVHTMLGPVWVTSPGALHRAGLGDPPLIGLDRVRLARGLGPSAGGTLNRINLGWLLLQADEELEAQTLTGGLPGLSAVIGHLADVTSRLALVSDQLFSQVVNDNLEIRTSVSIDPATGAADDKALFTFEALPRSTVLYFDVVINNPGHFQVENPDSGKLESIPHDIAWVATHIEQGMRLFEHLGIGGMNTRGLGRLRVLGI